MNPEQVLLSYLPVCIPVGYNFREASPSFPSLIETLNLKVAFDNKRTELTSADPNYARNSVTDDVLSIPFEGRRISLLKLSLLYRMATNL